MTTAIDTQRLEDIREIALEVLELDDDELTDTSLFVEDHDADSLRAIEILARIEKKFKVDIPQSELPAMINVEAVNSIVSRHLDGQA